MTSTAFVDRSRRVSKRFLQTAVVVDDQPHYLKEPRPGQVTPPSRGGGKTVRAGGEDLPPGKPPKNDLRAKLLADSFASRGIVCAILQPVLTDGGPSVEREEIQEVESRADLATQRADIVILDWNLRGDDANPGSDAKGIIRAILKTDDREVGPHSGKQASRRLRLIAVYTGEAGLSEIASELHALAVELELPEPKLEGYCVEAGPVTFVVYGKEGGTIQDLEEDETRRVNERDLPERLLADFTAQTSGLLSNVTLASLSAVRDNTHRILSRFSPQVDAPYVAHRAMLTPPDEAEDHPVPLVAAEIEGVLADDQAVPELVGQEALREWLETVENAPMGEGLEMERDRFREALLALAIGGLKEHNPAPFGDKWKSLIKGLRERKKNVLSKLTNEMTPLGREGEESDQEFAALTATKSQYDEPRPVLRLGTVVAVGDSDDFRLCVQPVCDSVRLPEEMSRSFPMLKLYVVQPGDLSRPFELVVRSDSQTYVRLRVSLKPHDLTMLSFEPTPGRGTVTALGGDSDGYRWFRQPSNGVPGVRWVSDLKPAFAHRIANRFGAEVSRVGLTESEWLRRMAS